MSLSDEQDRLLIAPRRALDQARQDPATWQSLAFYREATPWGLAPDLTLAGFLVAEHRQIQDVWLHWQAKNINFDTAMGYHLYHLLTPGLAATADAVRSSSHPERERVLTEMGAALFE